MVDWLHSNVEGFIDRRHARKYAAIMLKVRSGLYKSFLTLSLYYSKGLWDTLLISSHSLSNAIMSLETSRKQLLILYPLVWYEWVLWEWEWVLSYGNEFLSGGNYLNCFVTELTQIRLSDNSGGETDTLGPLPSDMGGNGPVWSSSDDQISLPTIEGSNYYPHIMKSHSNSPGKNFLYIKSSLQ